MSHDCGHNDGNLLPECPIAENIRAYPKRGDRPTQQAPTNLACSIFQGSWPGYITGSASVTSSESSGTLFQSWGCRNMFPESSQAKSAEHRLDPRPILSPFKQTLVYSPMANNDC